jgi:primase-polymerase (primpol)-like protein
MSTATRTEKPFAMPLNPEGLPDDPIMREARFVVWGWTWNAGKGKWDKPPMRALDGRAASVTNAADHTDLARALGAVKARGFDGIGLVLQQGLGVVGIDLDKCRDASTGVIEPWAQAIIDRFRSYWEPSASGTGIRIFVRGQLPPGRRRGGQIEVYEDGRYLTINGNSGPGASRHFEERQAELDVWHIETFGTQEAKGDRPVAPIPATLDDTTLLDKAFAAKNGRDFERRHQGVLLLENPSDDDWAYFMALAFWTQGDPGQMRRIALASGRVRAKWLERRPGGDWLDYNIAKACNEQHEVYAPERVSGSRVVFTIPTISTERDATVIAQAVAERDAMIARLEAEREQLAAQLAHCREAHQGKDATIVALQNEVAALEAASRHTDQTIGGALPDVRDEALRSYQRGATLVEDGHEYAEVFHKSAAAKGRRSAQTVGKCIEKLRADHGYRIINRPKQIETEQFKGTVMVDYVFIPPELRVPEQRGKALLYLLPPPAEKKHGGARRKVVFPDFGEPVAGPVKVVTEKKRIWSAVATEKTLLVETLDSHTEHFAEDGTQMVAAEVDAFKISIGMKVKEPAYRPTVQLALAPEDIDLTTIPSAGLDEPRRPVPLYGSCAQPGCTLPALKDHALCSRHNAVHGYSMAGAD